MGVEGRARPRRLPAPRARATASTCGPPSSCRSGPTSSSATPRRPGTLGRLVKAVNRHQGPAILTHEFMCGAGREQAAAAWSSRWRRPRCTSSSPPATPSACSPRGGRSTSRTAAPSRSRRCAATGWAARASSAGGPGTSAASCAVGGGTSRPSRCTCCRCPPPTPRATSTGATWPESWASTRTVTPPPEEPRNPALGVVQIELLRRVNPHLTAFRKPVDRGTWIRGYLAEGHLVQPGGRAARCRRRAGRGLPRARRPCRRHHRAAGLPRRRRRREPAGARGAPDAAAAGHRVGCGSAGLSVYTRRGYARGRPSHRPREPARHDTGFVMTQVCDLVRRTHPITGRGCR